MEFLDTLRQSFTSSDSSAGIRGRKSMSKLETDPRHETPDKAKDVLSRLIAEQGVRPIDDLDELAALWPADDDPDALMRYVLSERQARLNLNAEDRQAK